MDFYRTFLSSYTKNNFILVITYPSVPSASVLDREDMPPSPKEKKFIRVFPPTNIESFKLLILHNTFYGHLNNSPSLIRSMDIYGGACSPKKVFGGGPSPLSETLEVFNY